MNVSTVSFSLKPLMIHRRIVTIKNHNPPSLNHHAPSGEPVNFPVMPVKNVDYYEFPSLTYFTDEH